MDAHPWAFIYVVMHFWAQKLHHFHLGHCTLTYYLDATQSASPTVTTIVKSIPQHVYHPHGPLSDFPRQCLQLLNSNVLLCPTHHMSIRPGLIAPELSAGPAMISQCSCHPPHMHTEALYAL